MSNWNYVERNGIQLITINEWLHAGVNIAFSTRMGGCSEEKYTSLNMGLHVGDQEVKVLNNRNRFVQACDSTIGDIVCCQQIHGNEVVTIKAADKGRGSRILDEAIPGYDAMITNTPGLLLMTFYADCIPVFFFDPVNRAVGIAHSGWKGTWSKIVVNTLKAMRKEYNSSSEDLHTFIGPGIGPCCYTIRAELAEQVNNEFKNFNDIIYNSPGNVHKWDLKETNRQLLINNGVNPEHIIVCRLCTSCQPNLFFSYRRDKGQTGRMGGLIGLKY